ncbi:MAG: LacI family DNA-binding transcriptional regulator [Tissierellia bacterium]|nr:LacI family DNA-binding transcriptional regulator [Tissierellia bacterium]
MSKPTIKDVAKLAGVSISTVSRVMNDSKPVSPEARRKVLDAIEKLDFKPNELARSLVMRRSNLIGIVVKDIGIPYMAQIIRGIEEIGRMYKYDIMLSSTYGDQNSEKNVVDFLLRKQVEGIILISEDTNPEILYKLKSEKPPFIQIDKFSDFEDTYTVRIDYDLAIQNMMGYLIDKGHRKIAFIKGPHDTATSEEKNAGYHKACEKHGLEPVEIESKGNQVEDGYELGPKILELKDEITCVMFSDDCQAVGFMNYCYDHDVKIPEDISVTGFGDQPIARYLRPALTTIQEPYYDIGAVSMRILVKVLRENYKIQENTFLPSQIMERESVKDLK